MSKHAYKNTKQQEQPKNRLNNNAATSIGPEPLNPQDIQETQEEGLIPEQEIQLRAYEIYQQKGGADLDNWLEAEKNLREERRRFSNR